MILCDQAAHAGHPGQIRFGHESSPLADQERSDVFLFYEEPVVVPAILLKRLIGKITLEPGLHKDGRTVIMRRIDDLGILRIGAEINRVIPYAAEVPAPPVEKVIAGVGRREVAVRRYVFRVDLDALDHDQHVGVDVEHRVPGLLRDGLPVVRIIGIVPDCRFLVRFAVRFVLQIKGNHRVVRFVPVGQKGERVEIVFGRYLVGVPEILHVSHAVRLGAVNIEHDLDAVLLAGRYGEVKDLKARKTLELRILRPVVIRVRVTPVLPAENELRRNRDAKKIKAVIRDRSQCFAHVARPAAVENIRAGIVSEPVESGKPDLRAVRVQNPVPVRMEPVVASRRGRYVDSGRPADGGCRFRCRLCVRIRGGGHLAGLRCFRRSPDGLGRTRQIHILFHRDNKADVAYLGSGRYFLVVIDRRDREGRVLDLENTVPAAAGAHLGTFRHRNRDRPAIDLRRALVLERNRVLRGGASVLFPAVRPGHRHFEGSGRRYFMRGGGPQCTGKSQCEYKGKSAKKNPDATCHMCCPSLHE